MLESGGLDGDLQVPEGRAGQQEGGAMIEDIVGCLIAVAFGVAVAFQIGGET